MQHAWSWSKLLELWGYSTSPKIVAFYVQVSPAAMLGSAVNFYKILIALEEASLDVGCGQMTM